MKYFTKFLSLFFAAAMLLTMAACGSKNTDTMCGCYGFAIPIILREQWLIKNICVDWLNIIRRFALL